MSSLLGYLDGKESFILFRTFGKADCGSGDDTYICVIRFWAEGWSTIIHATGQHKYLAGARALEHYVGFCRRVGLVFDRKGTFEVPSEITEAQMMQWRLNDEAFVNGFCE